MTTRLSAKSLPIATFNRLAMPALLTLGLLLSGCAATSHATTESALGREVEVEQMLAHVDEPGPIEFERVVSADWQVDLSGLLNLDHEKAKAAGLQDHLEPIHIYFDVVRHPTKGTYLIDSGMDEALRDDPDNAVLRGMVASVMKRELLEIKMPLGQWLRESGEKVAGLWLTHLHLDHIAGIADLPAGSQVFTGPHEGGHRAFMNLFIQDTVDRALEGKADLQEWQFGGKASDSLRAIDIFGDGSAFVIATPGHTVGSVSYLLRTTKGPVLVIGDTCHTKWGWDNQVEPGTYSNDRRRNQKSLAAMRKLAQEHPKMQVLLGHQAM